MDAYEIAHLEFMEEIGAAYRGWFLGWTEEWTARSQSLELQFVLNMYAALNQLWPGMAQRRLCDPTISRPSAVPVVTNDPD